MVNDHKTLLSLIGGDYLLVNDENENNDFYYDDIIILFNNGFIIPCKILLK
ncbi:MULTISPECIES: hypothetical protein [Clostridium]|uniref:hypothetical protein n=1 Tax=Clostridium TaxID=1485 RepID=UPI000409D693|nr:MULTISPECIES: hypothetical protein [Clostridium]MDB2125984.1 hypothetical protein [Clostridium paraputrificum]MDU1587563.1 hypothetical protein [Clostridium sp.]MDU1980232.1 hypothetical protein [Clostridium sp.]MDU1995745.1 hypothetical protein [Clostridium sp.]MDU6050219.1 hypothetical protein [Clostridium sp.]